MIVSSLATGMSERTLALTDTAPLAELFIQGGISRSKTDRLPAGGRPKVNRQYKLRQDDRQGRPADRAILRETFSEYNAFMEASLPQYIEIRKNRTGQDRPYIVGTRVRVQDIVFYHDRLGQSPEEIVRGLPHLTLSQVHGALAYYFENRQAVWDCIRQDEEYISAAQREQTGNPLILDGLNPDAADSPVPS
jgi:uncharacterized protein (DUF433 family)